MVAGGVPACAVQTASLLFGLASCGGVDDRRAAPGSRSAQGLLQGAVDIGLAVPLALCLENAEGEVRSGEATQLLRRVRRQSETLEDLVAHDGCCCGRAGQYTSLGQTLEELADLHVLGAKVVPPFADAVGLVDGDQRAVELAYEIAEAVEGEALRGYVDELVLAAGHGAHTLANDIAVEGARQVGGRHATGLEGGDLVVHQRDEWRDDESRTRQQGCGQLVGEALATPGGGHEQHAADFEKGLDGLALTGAKIGEAESLQARFEVDAIGVGYHVFQAARMGHPAQPLLNRSLPAARSLR